MTRYEYLVQYSCMLSDKVCTVKYNVQYDTRQLPYHVRQVPVPMIVPPHSTRYM